MLTQLIREPHVCESLFNSFQLQIARDTISSLDLLSALQLACPNSPYMTSRHSTCNCVQNGTFDSSPSFQTWSSLHTSSPLWHHHPLSCVGPEPRNHSWSLSFSHRASNPLEFLLGPPSNIYQIELSTSYHWHGCYLSPSHPCLSPDDSSDVLSGQPPSSPPVPQDHSVIFFSNNQSDLIKLQVRSHLASIQNSPGTSHLI